MPILASIYAVFWGFITIGSVPANIVTKKPRWYTALGFAADLIVLGLFVSYWLPPFGRESGIIAVTLFMFSLVWLLGWIPRHLAWFESAFEERGLSPEMNRLWRGVVLALVTVLSFPAYWFGGMSAFRSL